MAIFTQGDYTYWAINSMWVGVEATDKTKTTYQDIPSSITYQGVTYSVTNMHSCFKNCTSLTTSPVIPNSVINMDACFYGCTSLRGDIYVYSTLLTIGDQCFYGTTQPIIIHAMNNNIDICQRLAKTANNNNVYVNIHPETPITFTDIEMNYKTDSGFIPVSLQTNANLVQCEVPDLVNGGTITTNVNDALIDLYRRGKIGGGA